MLRLSFVLALALALGGAPAFAGGKHVRGHKHKVAVRGTQGQKAERPLARFVNSLAPRISGLKQRLAAQGDVAKVRAAKQAHDKAARKSLKETLQSDRQTVRADHKALKQAVHAAVGDARGILGHRAKHAHKNKKAKK